MGEDVSIEEEVLVVLLSSQEWDACREYKPLVFGHPTTTVIKYYIIYINKYIMIIVFFI